MTTSSCLSFNDYEKIPRGPEQPVEVEVVLELLTELLAAKNERNLFTSTSSLLLFALPIDTFKVKTAEKQTITSDINNRVKFWDFIKKKSSSSFNHLSEIEYANGRFN